MPKSRQKRAPVLTERQQRDLDHCVANFLTECADAEAPALSFDSTVALRMVAAVHKHFEKISRHVRATLPHFAAIRRMTDDMAAMASKAGIEHADDTFLERVRFLRRVEQLFADVANQPRTGDADRARFLKYMIQQTKLPQRFQTKRARVERMTLAYLERIGIPTGGPRAARVLADTLRRTLGAKIAEDDELRVLQRARARLRVRRSPHG